MSPAHDGAQDFVAWYRQEHIRMLLEVPGWRRVRLFRQIEGAGPAFMAVHELESPDVFPAGQLCQGDFDAMAAADPLERQPLRAESVQAPAGLT